MMKDNDSADHLATNVVPRIIESPDYQPGSCKLGYLQACAEVFLLKSNVCTLTVIIHRQ